MPNTSPTQIEVDLNDLRDRIEILLAQIGNQRIRDLHGKPVKALLKKLDKHVAGVLSY